MSGNLQDDGHTVAGWTGFFLATTGAAVAGMGVIAWRPAIWLGVGLAAVAGLVTWLLHLAGWGKPPGPRPAGQRSMRMRDLSARQGHPDCLGCRLAGRRGAPVRTVEVSAPAVPQGAAAASDTAS
ncbi:HGxxPAAW family protein [Streptomyces sp. NPDC046931]|uniref:HGxxPAAW family protein n=1 Tax=Streptomyces sp. NPDC046931 TaxID=3154806 RepID=UPI0033F1804D